MGLPNSLVSRLPTRQPHSDTVSFLCLMTKLLTWVLLPALLTGLGTFALSEPLRVDIKPETNRKDALTPHWENWMVIEGLEASHAFGAISVTLREAGSVGSGLAGGSWKPGYETKATVASDGVFVKDGGKGGSLELVIHGLVSGRHSITTYHNWLTTEPVGSCSIAVDGQVKLKGVQPSNCVTSDTSATSAFVEFVAVADKDVVITIQPEGNAASDNVIINGFAIDSTDPAKLAASPSPTNDDEHAVETTRLTWRPSKGAVSHHLYLGTNAEAVADATQESLEFKGSFKEPAFAPKGLNHLDGYYWRVDEVDDKQTVSKGEVWHFGIRHLAFPSAEGYGRFARGGRGGRVIEVRTLEDYDTAKGDAVIPGSLREAVEAEGPRTIVFRVSGLIRLKKPCAVHNPYCTLA
ncbi:MAG: hypothetical protein QOD99_2038, partial [Chthoniobacter sp.]|nr:hypothetical protein [Chthoniobacter sp.]